MTRCLAIACVLGGATTAHADTTSDGGLDPDTAQRLSIIGTAVPATAIGLGLLAIGVGGSTGVNDFGTAATGIGALVGIVSPSLGEFAARRPVTLGMGLRAVGAVVEVFGLFAYENRDLGDCSDLTVPCHHPARTYALLATGAALYAGGMFLDIVHAPVAAREWNTKHQLRLAPTAMSWGPHTVNGAAVSLRF